MDNKKPRKPKPGGVHAGHRHRMRQRFLATGLDGFQDHEVLELLLYYAIPRRDVNETAHLLLDRFGTLAGVLDAPESELCTVPGVGPGTAQFLTLIPQLSAQMDRHVQKAAPIVLETSKDVAHFLANHQSHPLLPGQVLLVLTNRANRVLAVHRYDSFQQLEIRDMTLKITGAEASLCIFIEHVFDCTGFPLPGRLEALNTFSQKLRDQRTPLWDYFAVDDLGHPPNSYAASGRLLPW